MGHMELWRTFHKSLSVEWSVLRSHEKCKLGTLMNVQFYQELVLIFLHVHVAGNYLFQAHMCTACDTSKRN